MRQTIKKLTQGATRLLVLALGLGLVSTGWATVSKPLAIWNGDFVDGDKRGPITLNRNNHTIAADKSKITIGTGTTKGGVLFQSDTGYSKIGAVISLANVTTSSAGVSGLMGIKSNDHNCRVWTGIKTGAYNFGTWKNGGSGDKGPNDYPVLPNDQSRNYIGMISEHNSDADSGTGTSVYLNKTQVVSGAYTAKSDKTGSKLSGISAGGYWGNGTNNWSVPNAWTDFIAIFNASDEDTVQYWSLTDMTSAATFADGGTIATGTDYTKTGINLNGGTITVSGEITAAAIFVQADTTLSMAAGTDKLASTGPVYIADGVTLTINVTANPSGYAAGTASDADLITGTLFVANTTIKSGTLASVSGGKAGIMTDAANNKIKWKYTPMPVWNNGAWANANAPDSSTTEIAIDSSSGATFNAGGSYSAVYVIGTGTLAIGANGLTATTLDVASGASINMENMTATTITGAGTVIYDGTTPTSTIDASWIGTVWVKNILQSSDEELLPNSWGNSSSVLRFTNVTGWLANDTISVVPVELVDDGSNAALTLHYTTAPTTTLTFNEFRGSGTFATTAADSTWPQVTHKVLKWNSFTGSLNIDRGRFVFGSGTFSQWRCICVSANQSVEVASGATWRGTTGFVVDSGATLTATGTLAYGGLDGNAVSGSGTVVFDGKTPNTGTDWWTTSGWTGTVWVKNINPISDDVRANYTQFSPNDYGWTGSTLKVTGIKGFISGGTSGFTINPKLELEDGTAGYGLWLSDGYGFNSDNGNYSVLTELKGTGSLIGSGSGDNVMLMVRKWSDFAGTLSLTNKVVVFGTTKPTKDTINSGGYIIVDTDQSVTIPSTKTWYAQNKIIVNGTLSATGKDRWASTVLVNDDGVLELTSASNTNESSSGSNKDYSSVTGTGTLKYTSSSGWRTFPNDDAKMPATTLTIQVEVADSLIITKGDATNPTTIGSLSGTKNIRSDWEQVNGATTARLLNINQTKDTTWSGRTANGDRIDTITVSGGGTLTLAASENGNADKLAVATTGSVNLSGLWNGDTTVSGTFGGTGTLTGNLTFSDGATFKAYDGSDPIAVSGTVTFPTADGETATIDLTGVTLDPAGTTLISGATSIGAINKVRANGAILKVESGALKAYPVAALTKADDSVVTYPTAQEAVNATRYNSGYKYVTIYQSDVSVTMVDTSLKLKLADGVTGVTVSNTYDEYAISSSTESGVTTYTLANNHTVYTWDSGTSAGVWSSLIFAPWRYSKNDTPTEANRAPASGDDVIFASGASVTVGENITVDSITNSAAISFTSSSDVTITATSGGVVLTDAAASITVSGVTLSPTPTTTVANSYVKLTGSTYSVAAVQDASISDVTFDYYASYTNADVTATVGGAGTYTLTVQGKDYVANAESEGTVTFENVDVSNTELGSGVAYTITATGAATGGTSGTSEQKKGTVVDGSGWMLYNKTAIGVGSWTDGDGVAVTPVYGDNDYASFSGTNIYAATGASTGDVVTVSTVVAFGGAADPAAAIDPEAQAALRINAGESGNTFQVYTAGPAWVDVGNDGLGAPVDEQRYTVGLRIDYGVQKFYVTIGKDETVYSLTNAAGVSGFDLAKGASGMRQVQYNGSGSFVSIEGANLLTGYMADVGTEGNVTNVAVSADFVSEYLAGEKASAVPALISPTAERTCDNGLNYFESYALGLNPTSKNDAPIVNAAPTSEGKIELSLTKANGDAITPAGNVDVDVAIKEGSNDVSGLTSGEGARKTIVINPASLGIGVHRFKAEIGIGAK